MNSTTYLNSSAYFAPLVIMPDIITGPGKYVTRRGETVTITDHSTRGDRFGSYGTYDDCGTQDRWHRSGRTSAAQETKNDIIARAH